MERKRPLPELWPRLSRRFAGLTLASLAFLASLSVHPDVAALNAIAEEETGGRSGLRLGARGDSHFQNLLSIATYFAIAVTLVT